MRLVVNKWILQYPKAYVGLSIPAGQQVVITRFLHSKSYIIPAAANTIYKPLYTQINSKC